MPVRAKFKVQSITRSASYRYDHDTGRNVPGEVHTIRLQPVYDGTEENKQFFASTPSGQIELGVVNASAGSRFDLEGEYYVDFTRA